MHTYIQAQLSVRVNEHVVWLCADVLMAASLHGLNQGVYSSWSNPGQHPRLETATMLT